MRTSQNHLKFIIFTVCLLFAVSIRFFIKGFFLTKRVLTNKTQPKYPISSLIENITDSNTTNTFSQ